MTDQQTPIAPCPFCGGEASVTWEDMCIDCMGECTASMYFYEPCVLPEAIEKWNRRTPPPAPVEFAYKDIAEYEDLVGYKVNDTFRMAWDMARTTMTTIRALGGKADQDRRAT